LFSSNSRVTSASFDTIGLYRNGYAAIVRDYFYHALCTFFYLKHNSPLPLRLLPQSVLAIAAPIPFEAPVTTATLSFNLLIVCII